MRLCCGNFQYTLVAGRCAAIKSLNALPIQQLGGEGTRLGFAPGKSRLRSQAVRASCHCRTATRL